MSGPTGNVVKKPVVDALVEEWTALDRLLTGLTPEQWARPTCLPAWRVADVVAHLVGTEAMIAGEPTPAADLDVTVLPHVHNDIAAFNERWILSLRDEPPAAVLDRFRKIVALRAATLEGMSQADFDAPSQTPVGPGSYGRFMQIRIYDCWTHEQDIRQAIGLPGHEDGPVAEAALDEVVRALGYVVGKRAAAPDGAIVVFDLTGPVRRLLTVAVDGRARVVAEPDRPPTATLRLTSALFMRLCAGRVSAAAPSDVTLEGDLALARRVLDNLNFTI